MVSVAIDPGWHINANPASLPYLIPTTVEVKGIAPDTVIQYPVGELFSASFSTESLSTYQGTIEIFVAVEPDGGFNPMEVNVRYQACSDTICLAPASTQVIVQ